MRWSEIEQDIILWKWLSHQLLGRLAAFTPSFESSSLFAYNISSDTSCIFPFLRMHTYISRYRFSLAHFFFGSNYFLPLRVHRSIRGRSHIAPCLVSWRLAVQGCFVHCTWMSQRSSGDVRAEAKEGILYVQLTSEYVGECVEPRSDRHCDRAKGGSVLSHFLLFHFLPLYRHLRDKSRSMISPSAVCTGTDTQDFDIEQLVHLEQTCVPGIFSRMRHEGRRC